MKVADISVQLIDSMGSDLSVVNAARVSFDKHSDWEYDICDCCTEAKDNCELCNCELGRYLKEGDVKLIKYLAKHKHFSPFNHTFVTLKVKAPVFCARQLVKHEYMPWNEESRRYINTEPEFYIPKKYRKSAENVKQGSSAELVEGLMWIDNKGDGDIHGTCDDAVTAVAEFALQTYNNLIAKGVCFEQARIVLPQNMMVNWYWSGTLKAVSKMLGMRLDSHTQRETQEVAKQIVQLVEPIFPVSLKALLDNAS